MGKPGTIRVLAGVLQPPLLETDRATIVEFRDAYGDLNAVYSRVGPDLWMFVTKKDPDWESNLIRLGYMDSPITIQQLVREAGNTQ